MAQPLGSMAMDHLSIPTPAGSFDAIASGPADGRPVLLLHGFPEAAVSWEYQVSVLGARGYRAVAPDQRGYSPGVRPERPEAYSVTGEWDFVAIIRLRQAEDLAELVTARLSRIRGIRDTHTMVAFEVFSQHDLEAMFSIGA
jgi:pimeloyl-ACP methyl ester carboxylesterase